MALLGPWFPWACGLRLLAGMNPVLSIRQNGIGWLAWS